LLGYCVERKIFDHFLYGSQIREARARFERAPRGPIRNAAQYEIWKWEEKRFNLKMGLFGIAWMVTLVTVLLNLNIYP
jgi:hypothetical protein